jgi:hypothetical protein
MLSKLNNSWVSVLSFEGPLRSFAQTAGPLTKLTRKDCAWKGGPLPEDAQKAFVQLQSKLSSRPCLTPSTLTGSLS